LTKGSLVFKIICCRTLHIVWLLYQKNDTFLLQLNVLYSLQHGLVTYWNDTKLVEKRQSSPLKAKCMPHFLHHPAHIFTIIRFRLVLWLDLSIQDKEASPQGQAFHYFTMYFPASIPSLQWIQIHLIEEHGGMRGILVSSIGSYRLGCAHWGFQYILTKGQTPQPIHYPTPFSRMWLLWEGPPVVCSFWYGFVLAEFHLVLLLVLFRRTLDM